MGTIVSEDEELADAELIKSWKSNEEMRKQYGCITDLQDRDVAEGNIGGKKSNEQEKTQGSEVITQEQLALALYGGNFYGEGHETFAKVVQRVHQSLEEDRKNGNKGVEDDEEHTFTSESVKADLFVEAKPRYENGKVFITPSTEEAELGFQRWESSLVGFLVGASISIPSMKYFANSRWGRYGFKKLWKNDNGYYIFKFTTCEAASRVLDDGPWLIDGKPIMLQEWSPELSLHKQNIKTVPIWVRIYNIPLSFWHYKGIGRIAQGVGKTIKLDSMTDVMCTKDADRCNFARILVEVDSERELPEVLYLEVPSLWNDTKETVPLPVEYDWKPSRCPTCKVFGHTLRNCVKSKVEEHIQEEKGQTEGLDTGKGQTEGLDEGKRQAEGLDDGFQLVQNRKKGKAKMGESSNGNVQRWGKPQHQGKTQQRGIPQRFYGRLTVEPRRRPGPRGNARLGPQQGQGKPQGHSGPQIRHEQHQGKYIVKEKQGQNQNQPPVLMAIRQGGLARHTSHERAGPSKAASTFPRMSTTQTSQIQKPQLDLHSDNIPPEYTQNVISHLMKDAKEVTRESMNAQEWQIYKKDLYIFSSSDPETSVKFQVMGLQGKKDKEIFANGKGLHQGNQETTQGRVQEESSSSALMVLDPPLNVSHV